MTNSQSMKKIPQGYHNSLLKCLDRLRNEYNLYVEDDKEVIEAINIIREELQFNLGVED